MSLVYTGLDQVTCQRRNSLYSGPTSHWNWHWNTTWASPRHLHGRAVRLWAWCHPRRRILPSATAFLSLNFPNAGPGIPIPCNWSWSGSTSYSTRTYNTGSKRKGKGNHCRYLIKTWFQVWNSISWHSPSRFIKETLKNTAPIVRTPTTAPATKKDMLRRQREIRPARDFFKSPVTEGELNHSKSEGSLRVTTTISTLVH